MVDQSGRLKSRWSPLDWVLVTLLLAFQFLAFLYMSHHRLIGRDEGFYSYATRLVVEGSVPYLDFFYPQMPLFPFFYGGWMKLFGVGWIEGREFSAVLSVLVGLLLFSEIRRSGSRWLAVLASLVFCTSGIVLTQFSTMTTYALTAFLLLSSLYLFELKKGFLSGVLLGISIGVRLLVLPIFAVFFGVEILRRVEGRGKGINLLSFCFGVFLGTVPVLILYILDPQVFWFNNLGYHEGRTQLPLEEIQEVRKHLALILIGIRTTEKFEFLFLPFLVWFSLFSILFSLFRKKVPNLSVLIAFGVIVASLTPSPPYLHYFALAVPFLILGVFQSFLELGSKLSPYVTRAAFFVLLVFISIGRTQVLSDVHDFTVSGQGVIGLRGTNDAHNWRISTTKDVNQAVDSLTSPGDLVISLWPGSVLESHTRILPGLENHFGLLYVRRNPISEEEKRRYKLVSVSDLEEAISSKSVKVVVLKSYRDKHFLAKSLNESGYRIVKRIKDFSLLAIQ